ncbi:MAG: hypothetical protein B6I29_04650 [Marinitoga sp. 4572_148]|nr:MAG: hypothetical protein B6I29_04650 [Marinitoga sp. 4572_148]
MERKKIVVGKKRRKSKKIGFIKLFLYLIMTFIIVYFGIQMVRMLFIYNDLSNEYKKTQTEFEHLKNKLNDLEKERDMIKKILEEKGVTIKDGKIDYNYIPQTIEGTTSASETTR